MSDTIWSTERVGMLLELFEAGVPYSEIGKRMGLTKCQALGKAYRLGLQRLQRPPPPIQPQPHTWQFPDAGRCVWPIGHPGERGFGFCAAEAAREELPYCEPHCRIAYQEWLTSDEAEIDDGR